MPTPSEPRGRGGWAAKADRPRRSVFENYRAEAPCRNDREPDASDQSRRGTPAPADPATLQRARDLALARSFLHRYLAQAYEHPTPEGWAWLGDAGTRPMIAAASETAGIGAWDNSVFRGRDFESFHDAYITAFGHAARGGCPSNEIEYGDLNADVLFQPHRLADLAAFYRAFGLEVAESAGERQDHISVELEFMCVLAAKEAYALTHGLEAGLVEQCREAQKKFLREHLGRWVPAFTRRLAAGTNEPSLRALAELTRAFIESECGRFGVRPGSEDLPLRPVDEAAESLCASCGLANPPPGAPAGT